MALQARFTTLFTALFLLAPASFADPIMTIAQEGAGSMTLTAADMLCVEEQDIGGNGTGVWACDGSGQTFTPGNPAFTWELSDWNLSLDEDPFVSSAFGFANTGVSTTTYTITVTLPIAPLGPSTLMGGSTGGSVTDSNFDGLGGLSTVAPTAFYTGMIDGALVVPAAELHPDPFSVGFGGIPGFTASIPSAFFGLPGPTVPGPAVATSIGIQNKFSLSAGDSVASTNFFVVEVVPEPGTGLLLSLGLVGMSLVRHRRNRA